MLFREHHHSGRIAQMMRIAAWFRDFAHAVVNDQPTMSGEDGWSAATNLKQLPGRHRSREAVMRIKQAGMMRVGILQGHWAVGNPDAFMIEIHQSARALAGSVLGTSAAKKRSMEG